VRIFPPPEEPSRRRELGAIRGVAGADAVHGREAGPPPEVDHRLVRTTTMTAADARAHLATWQGEAASRPIAAPDGVVAHERRRPDRVHPGAVRLQRLAVAVHGDDAAVAHWSVAEPLGPGDERAWERALARIAAPPERGGWTA
jgi:hypothetical protein